MPFGARLFSFPDHNYTPDDIAENLEKLIDRLRDVAKQHDEVSNYRGLKIHISNFLKDIGR
jgi:hypothetical protein